jgi:16S rRNA (guanine966-N2)-methyltransferase
MSALGERLEGARVLDLFAGSGCLAIEALSRGASRATLVERARPAVTAIERNLHECGFEDRARLVRGDALRFLGRPDAAGGPFDLVFLDPPYGTDLGRRALDGLADSGLLAPDAVVVLEHAPEGLPDPLPPRLRLRRTVGYGDSCLSYLDPASPSAPQDG